MVTDPVENKNTSRARMAGAVVALLSSLALLGCESRTDKVDGGGVLLSITDFTGLPAQVSMDAASLVGGVQIGTLTVQSVVKNPSGGTSALMNVEIDSYEVVFSRADTGTRLPPPLVRHVFGVVPVNGSDTILNLPILTIQQLASPPLSDLMTVNGGLDLETGGRTILLNLSLRIFGRTLSGNEVDTAPARFTIEFTR
ncbi:MAG TPA: hypothetical protein VNB06_02210 [Thermoanaerobaculia bacterium]|nr:hypothetical protein [Thermoanaerobaculia bacterium]